MSSLQKAELLANKLDKMSEHFGIVESTINECTEYVESMDIRKTEDDGSELLELLREDFLQIRETVLDTMNNGRQIIAKLNGKLLLFEEDSTNADMISAFASLIKTVNDSAKILTGIYKDIITNQALLTEKKNGDKKESKGDVNIYSINGNISEIIKQMKGR